MCICLVFCDGHIQSLSFLLPYIFYNLCRFDFVSVPLVHPRFKRRFYFTTHDSCFDDPIARNDMIMPSGGGS